MILEQNVRDQAYPEIIFRLSICFTDSEDGKKRGFQAMGLQNDIQAVDLYFPSKDLLIHQKPKSLHIVDSALLNIRLVKSPHFKTQDLSSILTFSVSQLLSETQGHPGASISMDQVKINLDQIDDFLEFEVSEMVQQWILDSQTNYGLRIECDHCFKYGLFFSNEKVNMRVKVESIANEKSWNRRHISSNFNTNQACKSNKKKPRCCRESMKVDLTQLPGFDFIEQPKYFDAYMCKGRCPLRYSAQNAHAYLQSLMHLKSKKQDSTNVPKPCCVGTQFQPLDVLHLDPNDHTKLKVTHWKNVVVSSCGCV